MLAKSSTSSRTLAVRRGNWVRVGLWDITWIMGIAYWHLATASKAFLEFIHAALRRMPGTLSPDTKGLEPGYFVGWWGTERVQNFGQFISAVRLALKQGCPNLANIMFYCWLCVGPRTH